MAFTVSLGSITFGGGPDSDGDRFTVRDLPGWTGGDVELVTVDKPISDGAVVAVGRYKGRSVTIVGHAIGASAAAVWRVRAKLEACVAPDADSTLVTEGLLGCLRLKGVLQEDARGKVRSACGLVLREDARPSARLGKPPSALKSAGKPGPPA